MSIMIEGVDCKFVPDAACGNKKPKRYRNTWHKNVPPRWASNMSIIIEGVECKLVPDRFLKKAARYKNNWHKNVPPWFPAPPETPPFLQEEGEEDFGDIKTLKDPAPLYYPRESPKYQGFRPGAQFPKFWTQADERLPSIARVAIFRFLYGESSEDIASELQKEYNIRRNIYVMERLTQSLPSRRNLERHPLPIGFDILHLHLSESQVDTFEAGGSVSE